MPARASLISDVVYTCLPKGRDELRTGLHGLSPRARQLLQLVDGRRSATGFARIFPPAELVAYLALLEIGGFVAPQVAEPEPEDPPRALHALSTAATRDEFGRLREHLLVELLQRLGPAAESFALAVMRSTAIADLQRLVPAMAAAVEVGEGPEQAERFTRSLAEAARA